MEDNQDSYSSPGQLVARPASLLDRILSGDVEVIGPAARPDTKALFNACKGLSEDTPAILTDDIRAILARYSEREPVQVEVRPYTGAELFQCYANAAAMTQFFGGAVVTGWSVWRHRTLPILTLEHHAVYQAPDGSLIDVSPPLSGERAITFLPDADWDERDADPRKPGYTVPLVADPLIVAACVLLDRRDQFGNFHPEAARLRAEANRLFDLYERRVGRKRAKERTKPKANRKKAVAGCSR